MRIQPIAAAIVLYACVFSVPPSWADQVSVRIVSDPPGAMLFPRADRDKPLGRLPLELSCNTADPWRACVSHPGFLARWADGTEVVIRRIELCPEDGTLQEVRIAVPRSAGNRVPTPPERATAIQPASANSPRTVVCKSAGIVYKPLTGRNCGNDSVASLNHQPTPARNPTGLPKRTGVLRTTPAQAAGVTDRWDAVDPPCANDL